MILKIKIRYLFKKRGQIHYHPIGQYSTRDKEKKALRMNHSLKHIEEDINLLPA